MSKFKVGDTVKGIYFNSVGKVISTDAYGTKPLVVSWLDGHITSYPRGTVDVEVIKEPRVLYVNEYLDGAFGAAYLKKEEVPDYNGVRGIVKLVEVIE